VPGAKHPNNQLSDAPPWHAPPLVSALPAQRGAAADLSVGALTQPSGVHGSRPARLAQTRPVALLECAAAGQPGYGSKSVLVEIEVARCTCCCCGCSGSSSETRPAAAAADAAAAAAAVRPAQQQQHHHHHHHHHLLLRWQPSSTGTASPAEAGPPPLERVPLEAVPAAGQGARAQGLST